MLSDFLANLTSPPVLFFLLGAVAVVVRSDLDFPEPVPKLLSMYLLFAVGFKGGAGLRESGLSGEVVFTLIASMFMAGLVPLIAFTILRRLLSITDAAAVAAAYGSVSAVTFITAAAFLQSADVPYSGHMIACMALMESPAIIVGILLYRRLGNPTAGPATGLKHLLHEACLNGSVLLLLGSMVIGAVSSDAGRVAMKPFFAGIFDGALCFFLLDMGIVAMRGVRSLHAAGWRLPVFAIAFPIFNACIATLLVWMLGLPVGDGLLFIVLCASASYIAVPAAFRMAVPESNPSLYVSLSLGVTFPFNVAVGIPLYFLLAKLVAGTD